MRISIRLFGPLGKYAEHQGINSMEVLTDFSLGQLKVQMGIPNSSVGFIVVNGVKRNLDYQLQENDEVKVFPLIAGG